MCQAIVELLEYVHAKRRVCARIDNGDTVGSSYGI